MTNIIKWPSESIEIYLSVASIGKRISFTMSLLAYNHQIAYTMTTLPDTYEYYKNGTPFKYATPSQEILYGIAFRFADHFLDQLPSETVITRDTLISHIREFCRDDYPLEVEAKPDPFDQMQENQKVSEQLNELSYELPGVDYEVTCPRGKDCGDSDFEQEPMKLRIVIMHLNDTHKATRDEIADWLDKLYEQGVDLAFKDIPDGN